MFNDNTNKIVEAARQIMSGEHIEEATEVVSEGAEKDTKGDKEAYQKFFNDTLKKYGVKSPSELKADDEKKFYDEIDAGWKADDEKNESKVGKLTKDKKKKKNLAFDDEEDEPRVKKALRGESVELEEGKIDLKKKVKNEKEFESYMDSFKGPDILTAVEKLDSGEKHQKGTVGFFLSQQMSMKEGTMKLDGRRREFREKIKKLAYAKAKKMIQDEEGDEEEEEEKDTE